MVASSSHTIIMPSLKRQSTHDKEEEEAAVPSPTLPVKKRRRREEHQDHDHNRHNNNNTNTPTIAKHVRFASHSEVYEINDTGSNLTEQERNALYMSNEDQRRIFLEISETLAAAAAAENDKTKSNPTTDTDTAKNEGMVVRGLECIMQQRNSNRGRRMKAAVIAVMKRQRFHAIDEAWIIHEYRPLLEESKRLARERGLRDEIESGISFIDKQEDVTKPKPLT